MNKLLVALLLLSLVGCKDRFEEGYQAGYLSGSKDTELRLKKEYEEKLDRLERSRYSYSATSVETCGGGGAYVNGKQHKAGKTGCVRVYSDGRVISY